MIFQPVYVNMEPKYQPVNTDYIQFFLTLRQVDCKKSAVVTAFELWKLAVLQTRTFFFWRAG